jgi:phosphoadenosine phosphosulfate reductase
MFIKRQQMTANQSGANDMASAARALDVIDTRPRYTQADADALNARFEGVDAQTMLRALFAEDELGEIAVVSSFGTESAVLLHLVAKADPAIPVIFVDTLRMFPETLEYRETLIKAFGIRNASVVTPDAKVLAEKDENELRWSFDPDGCCAIRKVEPLARAKDGLDVWISGRKAFQSHTRENIARFEVEEGRLKLNPLGNWIKDDLDAYFEDHDLPQHPLEAEGFLSVGCSPCTSKVLPGEDARAGRWRGWEKVECGIHTPIDPDDPANQPVF